MGSGKTAVGKRLATLLGKQFFDSDAEIEKRTGVDIRYIFEKEGEPRFRERERDVIADLARSTASSSRRAAARCSIPPTASGSRAPVRWSTRGDGRHVSCSAPSLRATGRC